MRKDIENKLSEIQMWINECRPKAFICKQLKCKPETLSAYLKKFGIIYSGNRGGKGFKANNSRMSALEYSKKEYVVISKLRKKLIEDGIKEDKCESCKLDMWMGKKISLELHHLDGDRFNNDLDNLQVLCPNCHAQTENYGSNNKKK